MTRLSAWKASPTDVQARADFELSRRDLGYGLLLKRYVADPEPPTERPSRRRPGTLFPTCQFWAFRIMAGIGFLQVAVFAAAFVLVTMRRFETRWILLDGGSDHAPPMDRCGGRLDAG